LLLSHNSGLQNVVFGAVVSGRPPDLPGVETTIGLFINTLPVRIRVTPQAPLIAWLREIQATQMEMRHYEYSPLVQVQGWSEVPRGKPLFESILNFGNHPINRMYGSDAGSIEVRGIEFFERNHYPLVLQAQAHSGLSLSIPYDRRRFDKTDVSGLMRRLEKLLEAIASQPDATLGRLIEGLDQEQRQTVELRRDQFKATRSASLKNLRLKQSLS
jgi:non-ribosomal peptide synthetase component F